MSLAIALQRIQECKYNNGTELDLSKLGLNTLPVQLASLSHLQKLSIDTLNTDVYNPKVVIPSGITKLEVKNVKGYFKNISHLVNLEDLKIDNCKIDCEFPAYPKLKQLNIMESSISNLDGLRYSLKLEYLSLIDVRTVYLISDIREQWQYLSHICILGWYTEINKLFPIENVPNLQELELATLDLEYGFHLELNDIYSFASHQLKNISIYHLDVIAYDNIPSFGDLNVKVRWCDIHFDDNLKIFVQHNKDFKISCTGGNEDFLEYDTYFSPSCFPINAKITEQIWINCLNEKILKDSDNLMDFIRLFYNSFDKYLLDMKVFDFILEAKMLLLGEPAAGKTSLRSKLILPESELYKGSTTHGIDAEQWIFDYTNPKNTSVSAHFDGSFRANVFDFGGQYVLKPAHRHFLNDDCVYVLVVSSREAETMDWYKWLQSIRYYGGEKSPIFILFNNKEKQILSPRVPDKMLKEFNVTRVLHTDLSQHNKYGLSVLNKHYWEEIGLEEVSRILKNTLQNLPHIGDKYPLAWIEVRKNLKELLSAGDNYISIEKFRKICSRHNVHSDAENLASLLDMLGDVFYFRKPLLRDFVILDKNWITLPVYEILWNERINRNFGKFDKSQLCELLKDNDNYEAWQMDFLLAVMNEFGVAYRTNKKNESGENVYISPLLSDVNPPANFIPVWERSNNEKEDIFRFKIVFPEFMPYGLLFLLIVRAAEYISNEEQWRNGVVFDFAKNFKDNENHWVEVEEIREGTTQELRITVLSSQKRQVFAQFWPILWRTLQEMDEKNQLKTTEMFACVCDECKKANEPEFYKSTNLKKLTDKKINFVQCPTNGEPVFISEFFFDYRIKDENTMRVLAQMQRYHTETNDNLDSFKTAIDNNSKVIQTLQKEFIAIKAKNEDVEKAFALLADTLQNHAKALPPAKKDYSQELAQQLPTAGKLDKNLQQNLSLGLQLLEELEPSGDFSIAVVAFCKPLESLLKAIFDKFLNEVSKKTYPDESRQIQWSNYKESYQMLLKFANNLNTKLGFGDMIYILEMLQVEKTTMQGVNGQVALLVDFRKIYLWKDYKSVDFATFVSKLKELQNKDYRNKAAHSDSLLHSAANDCQKLVFEAIELYNKAKKP